MRILKVAWLTVTLAVALPLIVTYNTSTHRDNDIVLGVALLALTFPVGIFVAGGYAFIGYLLERLLLMEFPVGRTAMAIDCVVFLTAGYLQWFVLLPAIWCRLARRRRHANVPGI